MEYGVTKKTINSGFFKLADFKTSNSHADAWVNDSITEFESIVSASNFPCLFGKKAFKSKSILVATVKFHANGKYEDLKSSLEQYTNFVKSTPIQDRIWSPLIVFFDEKFFERNNHFDVAWDALNWVHAQDTEQWPENIPHDPEDPKWAFCFNDVPLFINMSSGGYKILKNRNLGRHLVFVINPRENFDFMASLETKSGVLVREAIRARVVKLNDQPIPAELGFYGDESNREWMQYQLSEEALPRPSKCPFHFSLN